MNLNHKIIAKLNNKYDNDFHFFQVKAINEILYDQTLKISTIMFKDIAVVTDRNQYLKRYYFFKNSSQRNEIVERIRMLTDFYEQNLVMRYEYPTMVVTGTKNLFQKRIRRMKKMVAMEDSSDYSSSKQDSTPIEFSSETFLKTIPSDMSKSSYERKNQAMILLDKCESDGSVYEIYQEDSLKYAEEENQEGNSLFKKDYQEQQSLAHLIFDFDDMDVQEAFKNYSKAVLKTGKSIKQETNSDINKKNPHKSHMIITPLDYLPQNNFKNPKKFVQKAPITPIETSFNRKRSQVSQSQQPDLTKTQILNARPYFSPKKPELKPDFLKMNGNHQIKTDRYYEDATRDGTYHQRIEKFKNNIYHVEQSHEIKSGISTFSKYPYPDNRPTSISPPQFSNREVIANYQYKKALEAGKGTPRNMQNIKKKALALLSQVRSQGSLDGRSDHFEYTGRYN